MIEDSTLGFNLIDGLPTDSDVGSSTTMTELDWQAAIAMFFNYLAWFSTSAHPVQTFDFTVVRTDVPPIFHSAIY